MWPSVANGSEVHFSSCQRGGVVAVQSSGDLLAVSQHKHRFNLRLRSVHSTLLVVVHVHRILGFGLAWLLTSDVYRWRSPPKTARWLGLSSSR